MMQKIVASEARKTAILYYDFEPTAKIDGFAVRVSPEVRLKDAVSNRDIESVGGGRNDTAALFGGGAVDFNPEKHAASESGQRFMSFFIRLRNPTGKWNAPLLRQYDDEGRLRFELTSSETELMFNLFTDYRNQALSLGLPFSLLGAASWHSVIGRYSGARVELFVDGVLVDEEWPIGALVGDRRGTLRVGGRVSELGVLREFVGMVDSLGIWDRALSDDEVAGLSDVEDGTGATWAVPPPDAVQYREAPNGGLVGDCLPFFHDGVYHFYYLFDRRSHRSKFGLGAHQWAHASSSDLVHWHHHPLAIAITDEREGSICTGSMFFNEGVWYAFYATRFPDRSEHLSLATSKDGITFEKQEPNPFASPTPPYKYGPFRDPHVFRHPDTGLFHMIVTAELENPVVSSRGGCLAHFVSEDLKKWEQCDPFLTTGYGDQPECSELFFWNGWYYLVFSHFGVAHYRMSRSPDGPWQRPVVDSLDGSLARVMKSAEFTGGRRIGAFFLDKGKGYAGCAIFREFVQHADGTLGSRWPREMVPATGSPVALGIRSLAAGAIPEGDSVSIDAKNGFGAATVGALPHNAYYRMTVRPHGRPRTFGIGIRGTGHFQESQILEFEPDRRKAGWRTTGAASWRECELSSLYEIDGLDTPFVLEIIAYDDVVDVCIDDRRTLINRQPPANGDRLYLYCQDGSVRFEHLDVRPLLDGQRTTGR